MGVGAVRSRGRVLVGLVLVPVLAVGACGDGATDRDAISKIITDGGRDPATICDHLSDRLLASFRTPATCRRAARAGRKRTDTKVTIDRLRIDGKTATADITGTDGRTTITFVKDGGSWKVLDTRQRRASAG